MVIEHVVLSKMLKRMGKIQNYRKVSNENEAQFAIFVFCSIARA